jgi:hypothetical protein
MKITVDFSKTAGMETLKEYMQSIFYHLITNAVKFRRKDQESYLKIER